MTHNSIKSAGIDVSKHKLDLAIYGKDKPLIVANTEAGWAEAAAWLRQAEVDLVGLEATGGYERGVRRFLEDRGFTVDLLQPLQVKAFAKMGLRRAKSDRLDAVLIAHCTHTRAQQAKAAPDARFDAFNDHLSYIEQIEEDIVRCKTRLEHIAEPRLRRATDADIARLSKRLASEIARLRAAIDHHDDLAKRFILLLSIPTIGQRTALSLLIGMPELGNISREQAASLAGLAPFVRESGQFKGQSYIGGGRGRVRRALYMAALPGAFRWNPLLQAFYKRLVVNGKSGKCALVACARKLLIIANAVVARGTPWEDARPVTA
jgi:transposase